jgi:hypothetical protein
MRRSTASCPATGSAGTSAEEGRPAAFAAFREPEYAGSLTLGRRPDMRILLGYIDPGTGSLLLQAIAGGVAAAAVTAKLFWRRLLRFFRIRKPEEEGTAT